VASNRVWRTAAGASHEDTEWFRVVAWDQLAEQCHQLLSKGAHIYVEGRLQTRQWEDEGGQPRASTEVVASEVIVLGPGSAQGQPADGLQAPQNGARPPRRNGRTRPAAPPPGLADSPSAPPISLTEEDLPI
jgi:single-strand DNA-binding protein